MSLFFQHPSLFGLFALAGLPVLVHLISRARPPIYQFPNIEFLKRVLRRTARVRKPKDRILLALRTIALAALAAAFVAPFLLSRHASLPGEKSTVILLVDRSASMAAREGAGSRFNTACAEAARFLESSSPTAANLVWIDAVPAAVFPEPGPNIDFLSNTLKQATPRPEAGALDAAFDLALRQLSMAKGRCELIVLSDFQASAWKNFAPKLPSNVVLHTRKVASTTPPNIAVTQLAAQPAEPVAGQTLNLLAHVRNFSPDPVRTRITLDADGARQSQPIDLPAWGDAECLFQIRPTKIGPMPVTARTEADAFPIDDSRHAVIRVREALTLALDMPATSPDAILLHKFANSLTWLEIANPKKSTTAPDIRWISPWDGNDPDALRNAATNGTTVIVRPSATCPSSSLAKLLGSSDSSPISPITLETKKDGWSVSPEESHHALDLFRNGDFGNPFAGVFHERLKLPASLTSPGIAEPLAHYADGTPAITFAQTKGAPILLWNLSMDLSKSDWPTHGVFLPTLAEILLHTRPNITTDPHQAQPGSQLTWSSHDPAHAGAVTLTGPSDESLACTESNNQNGIVWQSNQPVTPGIHHWNISGQPIDFSAVNFPESESDLRPLESSPTFGSLSASSNDLVKQAALAQGLPLWQWMAVAALVFLIIESLILGKKSAET